MNPLVAAALRRHWPLAGATIVFVILMLSHQILFMPAMRRYEGAVARAKALGLSVDPAQPEPVLPPRVFARVTDNSMPPAAAVEQASSGVLAARLLEEMTAISQRCGVEVLASEPGPISQQEGSTIARAHLTLRGTYFEFVSFIDALSRGPHLIAVDRFTLAPQSSGLLIEAWVSRLVLKREGGRR